MAKLTLLHGPWSRIKTKKSEYPTGKENGAPTLQLEAQNRPSKARHLLDLPTEIFDDIISRLDIASATCLLLCNKSLKAYPGLRWKYYQDIRMRSIRQRVNFLALLTRESISTGVCWKCGRLYDGSLLRNPGDPRRMCAYLSWEKVARKDRRHDGCCHVYMLSWVYSSVLSVYTIKFDDVFLAMKKNRLGSTGLEKFDHLEVGHDKLGGLTAVTSCEARVVSNELLHRRQIWIRSSKSIAERQNFARLLWMLGSKVCRHGDAAWGYQERNRKLRLLQKELTVAMNDAQKDEKHFQFSRMRCCSSCPSEYMFEARRERNDQDVVFGLTTWCNFGSGLSDDDAKWKSRKPASSQGDIVVEITNGIRNDFEAQQGESVEQLSTRNVQFLKSRDGNDRRVCWKNIYSRGTATRPHVEYLESWYEYSLNSWSMYRERFGEKGFIYKRSIKRVWEPERAGLDET